jgi:predicted RNase H-like HicB family nuclease
MVAVEQDEVGWYIVERPAPLNCLSQRVTLDEAPESIREAIESYHRVRKGKGLPALQMKP